MLVLVLEFLGRPFTNRYKRCIHLDMTKDPEDKLLLVWKLTYILHTIYIYIYLCIYFHTNIVYTSRAN